MHPPAADKLEGGQQQLLDASEVVEDQRLVEGALRGDLARARTVEALHLERFERGLGDLELRSLEGVVGVFALWQRVHAREFSSRSKRSLKRVARARGARA